MDTENTEPTTQPPGSSRKPMSMLMKIGLFGAIALILISQLIVMVFLPLNPSHAELLISVGIIANCLAIAGAITLAIGAVMRHFGR